MISTHPCLHGRALPARLHGEEARHLPGDAEHVDLVVVEHEAGRAEAGPARREVLVGEGNVEVGRGQHRVRHAGQRGSPPATLRGAAAGVEQVGEGGAHLDLVDARAADVADDGGDDRPGRPRRAHGPEPVGALGQHVRGDGERLDVVHHGRVALARAADRLGLPTARGRSGEQAVLPGREEAGQRVAALDDLQERLLLAEEVVVRAFGDGHGELAQQTRLAQLDRGAPQGRGLDRVRALGRDVHLGGADGERGDGRALDHPVRIAAHQHPVLERRRLALGAVGHDVAPAAAGRSHGRPLRPRREAAAAATAESRCRDLVDGGRRAEPPGRRQPFTAARGEEGVDRRDRLRGQQVPDAEHAPLSLRPRAQSSTTRPPRRHPPWDRSGRARLGRRVRPGRW